MGTLEPIKVIRVTRSDGAIGIGIIFPSDANLIGAEETLRHFQKINPPPSLTLYNPDLHPLRFYVEWHPDRCDIARAADYLAAAVDEMSDLGAIDAPADRAALDTPAGILNAMLDVRF